MDVPTDVMLDLADYLRLEYGEDQNDANALQLADLRYAGSRADGPLSVHYWEHAGGAGRRWATAAFDGELWSLSMSAVGPDEEPLSEQGPFSTLGVRFNRRHDGQPALQPLRLRIDEMPATGFPMRFPNGEQVSFYLELYYAEEDQRPNLSIQILQGDEPLLAVRCESGVVIRCRIAGYDCDLQCGPGSWT